jgi:anti-anti-sigma factor
MAVSATLQPPFVACALKAGNGCRMGKTASIRRFSSITHRGIISAHENTVTRQMVFEIEQRDDVCVVRIGGRLATGADADYLQMKAREIKSMGCRKLIADIGELDSVGSAGLGFFVDLYTSTMKNASGRFVLAGPSPRVLEVLALTRLSTIIPIVDDLVAGLAYCAGEDDKARHATSSPR